MSEISQATFSDTPTEVPPTAPESETPLIDPDDHPDLEGQPEHEDAADPDVPDNVGQDVPLDDPDDSDPPA